MRFLGLADGHGRPRVDRLVDPAGQEALRARMAALPPADGAREIAEALVGWGREAV